MNTREQLNQYLRGLESRLRWLVVSKGAAVAAGVALLVTLAMVLITNAFAFSSTSLLVARFILFLALAVAIGFGLVLPLLRLNQRRAAGRAETAFPEFEERLLTFVERRDNADPMLDLLAADTATVARRTQPARVAPPKSIFAFATSAGAAGAVLLWLILAGPGYLGYGAKTLWAGIPKGATAGFYDISVQPGNKLVRRKSDQMITATLIGFEAPQVRLYARYKSTSKWEEAPMLPRADGSAYEYLFATLAEPVEYYAEAAGVKSKVYRLDVADMPGIKHLKVTYHFPSVLGLPDATEDPGGDLRAVAGTVAELTVETDRPLKNGTIELDDGSHIALEPQSGNTLTAKVTIEKDGMYHFAATDQGQSVRLSEDYFIEAREDNPPSVKIVRPGRDAQVSPIEEVTLEVQGSDDFALEGMDLHYSVNGEPEKTVNLLPHKGVKNADGSTMIALEDYKLSPGDVVSVYATARDARTTSRTDIMFIETQPFERNYTQSQQMGGGGGGMSGDDQDHISEREKEIIAATWNQIRGDRTKGNAAENAKFLSEVQSKLKDQAKSLAARARSRELAGANQEFQSFVKDMEAAASEMSPASDKLKAQGWKDALEPETKALQHLLRAESTFRDIQVAFGGGGGGGGGAGRDLANLFDLELDTEKNQYETGQQNSQTEQDRQKQIDDALQKLEQLAQRQQELAQAQKDQKQNFEQRWQQEMLRRQAEELKKQMEQMQQQQGAQQSLSRNGSQSQSQSGQSSGSSSSSSSQSGSQGQQGSQGSQQQRMQQALDRLSRSIDDMRSAQQAASQGQQQQNQAQSEANAQRAAQNLQEAQQMLNGMRQQQASSQLSDLSQRAEQLDQHQRDFENRMKSTYGDRPDSSLRSGGGSARQQAQQLADEKDKMARDAEQLEKDMQKAARDMAGTQPAASNRVRDALSEMQQNEVRLRTKYAADNIRRGYGPYMVDREAPITRALDQVSQDLKDAQKAVGQGGDQTASNGTERSLQQIERMREQMEQMAGGQQNGQQQGGQQSGGQQSGQQAGGQQSGGQQGGGQRGGSAYGGQYGGNYGQMGVNRQFGGPATQYGRFAPEGMYNLPDNRPMDVNSAIRDYNQELNDMREKFKDNPDISKQIGDVQQDLSRLQVGDISSTELQNRLNHVVLPNLESLEVQMRREVDKDAGDQVRSGASDRVPPGFTDAVAEYFRKLSKGK